MPLLEAGQPVADIWVSVPDGTPIPDGPAIIPLERLGEIPASRNSPIGLRLPPTTPVEALAPLAGRAAMFAIDFPIFRDGRGFTLARTLRERLGYTGEIRATGHVLPDQYEFLTRCGFSSVETRDEEIGPWREALTRFHLQYQPAPGDAHPALLKHRQG